MTSGLRRRLPALATAFVVLLAAAWRVSSAPVHTTYSRQQASDDNLGVRVISPVYAIVPNTTDRRQNVTVALTVWLRRIGAADSGFELPHQSKDTIRMMVWIDDPKDLMIRKYGHLWLPVDHHVWRPMLRLETDMPGPILYPQLETTAERLDRVPEPPLRPYSLRVDVPPGAGNCFKLVEESFYGFKHPFCLPPAYTDTLCSTLAPPERNTPSTPALWMVVGPVRYTSSPRTWTALTAELAQRLTHYVSYHVAVGASGLLLYADELFRDYLSRHPLTAELLRAGTLRLVHWQLQEREHLDQDGRGRALGYNYDQALVAGHAFLGLSSCGFNLMLLITDLDEYLYPATPGNRWPHPYGTCMPVKDAAGQIISMHTLSRIEVLSSSVTPADEAALWTTPNRVLNASAVEGGGAGSGQSGSGLAPHPLTHYDLIYRKPMKSNHNKPITMPAGEIVAFFVHEGTPVQLTAASNVSADCLALLHVPNYFRQRTTDVATYVKLDESQFRPFKHWLVAPGSDFHQPPKSQAVQNSSLESRNTLAGSVALGGRRLPKAALPLLGLGFVLLLAATVMVFAPQWLGSMHRRGRK